MTTKNRDFKKKTTEGIFKQRRGSKQRRVTKGHEEKRRVQKKNEGIVKNKEETVKNKEGSNKGNREG